MTKSISTMALAAMLLAMPAQAQQAMPPEQMKQVIGMTRASWVALRDWNGRQLVYFTHLISYRCGLREVRYSINAGLPDKTFPLPECNPDMPFSVPKKAKIWISLPPETVKSIAVQVTFKDGSQSDINVYTPCANAGENACVKLVKTLPAAN